MDIKLSPIYDLEDVISKSTIESQESKKKIIESKEFESPERLKNNPDRIRFKIGTSYDIFSDEWCDLVFEGKNQLYGAFAHRKNSTKRHFYALILACVLILVAATGPSLIKQILPKAKYRELRVRTLSEINLERPKENNVLKELPPPPPPVARNTIKFTPPVIKPDEQVNDEDEPKMQKEMVDQKAAIGAVDFNKGTDDVTAPIATIKENTKISEDADAPFVIVEQMPQFPGGEKEMMKFIYDNLKYPIIAQEMGISGTVIVNFVIDREGQITNMKVSRSIGGGCDEEAIRVLGKMPRWSPGRQGGKTVRVSYTVPFKFLLQ
jgi:periplasmic protein TonB